jgi:hypothetical protein
MRACPPNAREGSFFGFPAIYNHMLLVFDAVYGYWCFI